MTSNIKWTIFGCCFLAVMAALAVYWVECKVAQVNGMVNGAVEKVTAPIEDVMAIPEVAKESFFDFDQAMADFGNTYIKEGAYTSLRDLK